jgi:glycosyltransferase involved in cell wall biosynthesis
MTHPEILSVIVPTFNEAAHITNILKRLVEVVLPQNAVMQVIVVNDGSRDGTPEIVSAFIIAHPEKKIILLNHTKNEGKGAAILTALPYLEGCVTVIQDGDEEYDPQDLAAMYRVLTQRNLPVLYGSRYLGGGRRKRSIYPSFYYGVRLLSITTNLLYGQHITDEATCYKMFRTDLLCSLPLKCRGFEFCPEVTALIARRGVKIEEIPIRYTPRSTQQGKKIRARDGLQALWTLLKLRL